MKNRPQACCGEAEERGTARADSLRTEFLEEELVAGGWEAQLTAATNNLEAAFLKEAKRGDSLGVMVGELVLQVEAEGARSSPSRSWWWSSRAGSSIPWWSTGRNAETTQ